MKNKIVFVGMPSCGKTRIGKRIAKALELDFIDTDNIIKQRAGRDLSEIIKTSGDDALLKFENEALSLSNEVKSQSEICSGIKGKLEDRKKSFEKVLNNEKIEFENAENWIEEQSLFLENKLI